MHRSMEADEPAESIDRPKVLLVDDIRDNRILISTILRRYGVEVDCANNGKEGVMKALLGDYDLILMDIQMPVMDGIKATEELRMHG